MALLKRKKVAFDGVEAEISELTNAQVEKYLAPIEELANEPKLLIIRSREVLADSFSNLNPQDPWTAERVKAEIGYATTNSLVEEILKLSGLRVQRIDASAAGISAGENAAASAS